MTRSWARGMMLAGAIGLVALLGGCATGGDEVAYGDGHDAAGAPYTGLDADYYQPGVFYNGAWDGGYQVGPFGPGGRGFDRGRFQHAGFRRHAYRSAPFSHAMPSLAAHGRGGPHGGGDRVGR